MSKEINLPPFYVGQEVVAVQDSKGGFFKKGDTKIVQDFYFLPCCKIWYINVGVPNTINGVPYCKRCGKSNIELPISKVFMFHNARYFTPITSTFQSISLEKILEKETELISSN